MRSLKERIQGRMEERKEEGGRDKEGGNGGKERRNGEREEMEQIKRLRRKQFK